MARGGRQSPRVRPGSRPLPRAATPVPAPIPGPVELLDEIPQLDELLAQHTEAMGSDAVPYRNHAYRVANLCIAFAPRDPDTLHKIAIAAALHDMGIWTKGTFDYLPPSIELAHADPEKIGTTEWR